MTRRIVFRPEAKEELAEATAWYEAHGKGLGGEFLRAIEATVAHIARNPLASPVVELETRRAVVRRFPYSILYTVDDAEIVILACFHGRRDPKVWMARDR